MFVVQIVVNHTPDRSITGTGSQSNNFHRVLSVENIVNPVSPAHFDRIDLIQVKMSCSIQHMLCGNASLVLLVGHKIFYRDLLKMDIGHEHTEIGHQESSLIAVSISCTFFSSAVSATHRFSLAAGEIDPRCAMDFVRSIELIQDGMVRVSPATSASGS